MKAETAATVQELLRSLYEEVTITVRNCTPQSSSGGCISLLISGLMSHKPHAEDRAFTQALILSRQSDGYYVKTDTVLVFPIAERGPRPCSLLTPSSRPTEIIESTEGTAAPGLVNEKSKHELSRAIRERTQSTHHHTCVPTIDAGDRTPSIVTNHDTTQPMTISFADGTMDSGKQMNPDFAFGMRYTTASDRQQFSSIDRSTRNRQGCSLANDRNRTAPASGGFMNHLNPYPDRCTNFARYPQQPWSLRSSPRNIVTDTAQPAPDEQFRLFACKLPLGITVEKVTEVFSQYGTLAEDEPIRVFTGQNNCYACVCYTTEKDMQNAIGAEIRIGENVVVTDEWRPRPRRPRRGRQDTTAPQQRPIGATTN